MKIKTSVTLSEELLTELERWTDNRSRFIEEAVRHFIATLERRESTRRDVEIYSGFSLELNEETADALEFQTVR